ncbi:hypothetical protein H0H93_003716 [Arthromyces matolae]|nr:hypothetical protein H0H93_003716 [Arthromyces matolae]
MTLRTLLVRLRTPFSALMTTVDDESPLISYQPRDAWVQHNVSTDAVAINFFGKTFTQTHQLNASLSFKFDGHSVTIYGSTNGSCRANIDGKDYSVSPPLSSQPAQPASLFAINTLDLGQHTITLTNLDATAVLTVDYILWIATPASKSGTLERVVFDDVDPSFHYQGSWTTSLSDTENFNKRTGQYANLQKYRRRLWLTLGAVLHRRRAQVSL